MSVRSRNSLPDDLVPGRERDQVGEAFERNAVARPDGSGNRVAQGKEIGHVQVRSLQLLL